MESCIPWPSPDCWTPPAWLESRLVPDGRFARAYNALADNRRALLKGLIARHYILNPPVQARSVATEQCFDLVNHRVERAPAPFAVILVDDTLDAPALFLAALLPALFARVPQVLAVRLGSKSAVSDPLLVACELAGQEQVAALGPVLVLRLLLECAASPGPGVVLYPETPALRRILGQKALQEALAASSLRLVPLRAPRAPGLWRDEAHQFLPQDVELLYGRLPFEAGGAAPGSKSRVRPGESGWEAFNTAHRELLLAPDARAGQGRARICVGEGCLGLWRWQELLPGLFQQERSGFSTAP